jgi:hypothetical protein
MSVEKSLNQLLYFARKILKKPSLFFVETYKNEICEFYEKESFCKYFVEFCNSSIQNLHS